MNTKFGKSKLRKNAFFVGGLAVLVSGCGVAPTTYGTGESVEVGLARDIAGLASFGTIGKKEKERISYTERPNLVVPPTAGAPAIPAPIDKVDQVEDSFPGREAELAAIEQRKLDKEREASPNQFIGSPNARPLSDIPNNQNVFSQKKKDQELLADRGENRSFGQSANDANTNIPREILKTRQDLADELGIPVEQLPKTFEEQSLLERAGLVRNGGPNRSERLTDVPREYRTIQRTSSINEQQEVDELLSDKKKKKKKRFIFF